MFKLSLSLITFGGSALALFKLQDVPTWLRLVIISFAATSGIYALQHLPQAWDGLEYVAGRITTLVRGVPTIGNSVWTPRSEPSRPVPVRVAAPTHPPCVALAMSLTGQWAVDGGTAGCDAHSVVASRACAQKAGGPCHRVVSGSGWVAGVTCSVRTAKGDYSDSFTATGDSEADAYDRAFAAAARAGLQRPYCRAMAAVPPRR